MCPHHQFRNELMGKKDFVNPLYRFDAQKGFETTNSSDSEESEISENSDNSKEKDSDDVSVQLFRE